MNIKALSKIKHNGTVYEAGSTIFSIDEKDAKRLINLNVAEEVEDDFLNSLLDEDPDGKADDPTPPEKAPEENPKQSKKKKSDKQSDEE